MLTFFFVLTLLVFILAVHKATRFSEDGKFIRVVILGSLCYGVCVAILVRLIFSDIMESPAYFPDAYNYINHATQKMLEWRGEGTLGHIPLPTRGYTYFIAAIYSIAGQSIYTIIFMQLILASLIPVLTFLIARQFFDRNTAKLSAILVAFYPNLYVWASFVLKEILALFLIYLAVHQFLKFRSHPKLVSLLLAAGSLVFLLFVRPHIAVFLGLIFIFFFSWQFIKRMRIKDLVWLSVIVIISDYALSLAGLSNPLTMVFETPLPVYDRGEILVMATFPELVKMIFSGQLLPNLLLGIGRYLISPLPWQATNAYQALIPGIVLWYFVLPLVLVGVFRAFKAGKQAHILLAVILFLIFWYGLTATGTDPRWRLMMIPFVFIFGAYGFPLLTRNVSGVAIWIFTVLTIWVLLSIYSLGLVFVFWVLIPGIVVVALLSLMNSCRKYSLRRL